MQCQTRNSNMALFSSYFLVYTTYGELAGRRAYLLVLKLESILSIKGWLGIASNVYTLTSRVSADVCFKQANHQK